MELVQIKGNTWCLEGTGMIPVYRLDEHRCILLDSGWKREREEFQKTLEEKKLIPVGAIGTHAHVDHVGNHGWLKKTWGTALCLSAGEAAVAASPVMCKMLYSTIPLSLTLKNVGEDYLFQSDLILGPEDGVTEFMGVPFRIHHTPGHSPDHICIGTPDGVCYVGDLIMSKERLYAAQMPYHHVHYLARESMWKMAEAEGYSDYIIAHRGVTRDLASAVEENLERMEWVYERFLEMMEQPVSWDELMVQVLERNRLNGNHALKMAGYENIVQSYVDALRDDDRIMVYWEGGIHYFKRV